LGLQEIFRSIGHPVGRDSQGTGAWWPASLSKLQMILTTNGMIRWHSRQVIAVLAMRRVCCASDVVLQGTHANLGSTVCVK
jgi:hypothetical protein